MKQRNGCDQGSQRYHGLKDAMFAGSVLVVVAAAVAAWVIRRRPFVVAVDGTSMAPTLLPGDLLLARAGATASTGALVVVEHPARPGYEMVKRVRGSPGERIGDRRLRDDEYWVTGDNAEESTDSRQFGALARSSIRGLVWARYWPVSRARVFG